MFIWVSTGGCLQVFAYVLYFAKKESNKCYIIIHHIVTVCLLCPGMIFTMATVVNILEQLSSIKKSLCCTRCNNETACVGHFYS
jgi:hypothetical protein